EVLTGELGPAVSHVRLSDVFLEADHVLPKSDAALEAYALLQTNRISRAGARVEYPADAIPMLGRPPEEQRIDRQVRRNEKGVAVYHRTSTDDRGEVVDLRHRVGSENALAPQLPPEEVDRIRLQELYRRVAVSKHLEVAM